MVALLRDRGVAFAVIGAAAMAVHGVSRATRDLDLLVMSLDCLSPSTWAALDGVRVDIRRGAADDPLAGAVRIAGVVDTPVDVVVGRAGWQRVAIERAPARTVEGLTVPGHLGHRAAAPSVDRPGLIAEVEASLSALPEDARRLWSRIVGPR